MAVPLKTLVAAEVEPTIKKLLSPSGKTVAIEQANQLLLEDTVASLNQVIKTIRSIEDNEKGQGDTYVHECKYIKAQEAERILKELLGDPLQQSRLAAAAGGATKLRQHFITSDENLNKVLVTGPPDKLSQARDIMKRIDVPQQEGDKPLLVGATVLKTYPVPSGNAEAMVKILQDNYKQSTTVRITAVNDNSIMAWAGPGDQFDIARLIKESGGSGRKTERIELTILDAAKMVDTIKGIFGEGKTGAPFVEAQPENNALVVNGTTEQITEIKAALKAIGDMGTSNVRVFTLETGSARIMAEVLKEALEKQGKPVRIIKPEDLLAPGGAGQEKTPAPPSQKKGPGPSSQLSWPRTPGILVAQAGPGKPLFDPRAEKQGETEKGKGTITIMASGNKITVISDDSEMLKYVQQFVRLLTESPTGSEDFEVIRLKYANAIDAARMLDECFNGARPQQATTTPVPLTVGRRPGVPGRGGGGEPGPRTGQDRLRVVADPNINALLIKASPIDMLMVRKMIRDSIDTKEPNSRMAMKTRIIGPLKHASALEVSSVLRDVFRENINTSPLPGQAGYGATALGNPNLGRPVDAHGNPRPPSLSLSVEDRSNTLIVKCTQPVYEDLKVIVDEMEKAAKESPRTVQVFSIRGIDPYLVQQAIDAIQGRHGQ